MPKNVLFLLKNRKNRRALRALPPDPLPPAAGNASIYMLVKKNDSGKRAFHLMIKSQVLCRCTSRVCYICGIRYVFEYDPIKLNFFEIIFILNVKSFVKLKR